MGVARVYHFSVASQNIIFVIKLSTNVCCWYQCHQGSSSMVAETIFVSIILRSPWHNNNSIIFLNSGKQHENRKFILWQSCFFDIMRLSTLIEWVK